MIYRSIEKIRLDYRKALSIIQRAMSECSKDKVVHINGTNYFSITFDEKYVIIGVPKDVVIIDNNTHIHKIEFYLQIM